MNVDQNLMGFIRKLGALAFWIIVSFQSAFAGNEHEHLQYLPRFVDIYSAYEGKLGNISAKDLFSNTMHLKDKYRHLIPDAELEAMVDNGTLNGLCEKIAAKIPGTTPIEVMETFFEMKDIGGDPLRSYISSTTIRDELFRKSPEKIVKAVEHYLETAPFYEAGRTLFTVPEYLTTDRRILNSIRDLYSKNGMHAEFYYSITRSSVPKGKFEKSILNAQSLISSKGFGVDGIDISGSIYESMDQDSFAKESFEKIKSRIVSAFRINNPWNGSVRVHAFERSNTGKFYDGFKEAIRECSTRNCLPRTLRIGHINMLDDESISFFKKIHQRHLYGTKKLRPFRIVFEANIESNIRVHQAEIQDLVKTIEKIHRAGMTVVLGADGYGILGESSSFVQTLEKLKNAGMKRSSLRALIDDSLIPMNGTDAILKSDRILAEARDDLRKKILGTGPSSIMDYCNLQFWNRMKKIFH